MKKLLLAIIIISSLLGASIVLDPKPAYANHTCDSGPRKGQAIPHSGARAAETFCSGGVSAAEQNEADRQAARVSSDCKTIPLNTENCPFLKNYVAPAIRALSGAVGVVVLIMIAWGGLQYTSSRDNPQQTAQAKDHISNAVFALIMYIFMVAFLNWLVPGGLF